MMITVHTWISMCILSMVILRSQQQHPVYWCRSGAAGINV
jgi:hypothetical protein